MLLFQCIACFAVAVAPRRPGRDRAIAGSADALSIACRPPGRSGWGEALARARSGSAAPVASEDAGAWAWRGGGTLAYQVRMPAQASGAQLLFGLGHPVVGHGRRDAVAVRRR